MEEICMVIDFDGFRIGGDFLTREYGYYSLTTEMNASFRFDLRPFVEAASEKDWRTAMYVKRNITGLTLRPRYGEHTYRLKDLEKIIRFNYKKSKTRQKYRVAYKGGTVERDLLEKMGIPAENLEWYGCPKYDFLTESVAGEKNCGYHDDGGGHCPKLETLAFGIWIKENL